MSVGFPKKLTNSPWWATFVVQFHRASSRFAAEFTGAFLLCYSVIMLLTYDFGLSSLGVLEDKNRS